MVIRWYIAYWVIIYHLPPIKGTRNSYWLLCSLFTQKSMWIQTMNLIRKEHHPQCWKQGWRQHFYKPMFSFLVGPYYEHLWTLIPTGEEGKWGLDEWPRVMSHEHCSEITYSLTCFEIPIYDKPIKKVANALAFRLVTLYFTQAILIPCMLLYLPTFGLNWW